VETEGAPVARGGARAWEKRFFAEPHLDTPAEVRRRSIRLFRSKSKRPQGLMESIKAVANKSDSKSATV